MRGGSNKACTEGHVTNGMYTRVIIAEAVKHFAEGGAPCIKGGLRAPAEAGILLLFRKRLRLAAGREEEYCRAKN